MNKYTLEISEHLLQTVRGVVNDAITKKMEDFTRSFEEYVEDDLKWKERANPAVDFFVNVTWSKKFILAIIGFMATIVGFIALLKATFFK